MAPTTVPAPLASVSTRTLSAAPAMTLKAKPSVSSVESSPLRAVAVMETAPARTPVISQVLTPAVAAAAAHKPETLPPPLASVKPTRSVELTGLPAASVMVAVTVRVAPETRLLVSCVSTTWEAAPAPSVIVLESIAVRVPLVKRSVWAPAGPVILRLVNVAKPSASVVAVRIPPRVPEPVSMAAVIVTPLVVTALLLVSRS